MLQHSNFVSQFINQLFGDLSCAAFQKLRLLSLLRNIHALDLLKVLADGTLHFRHGHFPQRLVFRLLDADQSRISQFVDAGLNRQHGRQRHIHKLKIAGFELALYFDSRISFFNLHDDGRVWPAKQLRENNSGLRKSIVVRLQTGENQIELLIFDGSRESTGRIESIEADKTAVLKMYGAVGAFGQGFT